MASDGAAKEILGFAKNRLNKFYNPKLYKAPPKVTVLADVSAHKVAPPPPLETAAAFSKKSEESNGVIAMIDTMVGDLTKEMTEAKTEEQLAQEDYDKAMSDAKDKRTTDSKSLADKAKAKANWKLIWRQTAKRRLPQRRLIWQHSSTFSPCTRNATGFFNTIKSVRRLVPAKW